MVPNPSAGGVRGRGGTPFVQPLHFYKPYPWLNSVNVFLPQSGNSIYHAGVFSLQKRMSGGLSVLASYTYAKLIGDGSDSNLDYASEQMSTNSLSTHQDRAYNRRADRSVDPQSIRHR